MTDNNHPTDAEGRSEDHQHAIEACQHALDALENGDFAHARSLLDETQTAVEYAQYDRPGQAYRETAYDCYE